MFIATSTRGARTSGRSKLIIRKIKNASETRENTKSPLKVSTSQKVRCNCKDFNSLAKCKHAKYVRTEIEKNGGAYKLSIPEDIDEEEVFMALDDAEAFRNVVIKYGKVLVIH